MVEMTKGKMRECWATGHGSTVGSHAGSICCCCATAEFSGGSTNENVVGRGVQHPVVAFAGIVVVTGNFDEALVKAEIMADRVLPSLFVVSVVGKVRHDVFVNAVKGQTLLAALSDGHHDKGIVAVRRFVGALLLFFGISAVGILVTAVTSVFASRTRWWWCSCDVQIGVIII